MKIKVSHLRKMISSVVQEILIKEDFSSGNEISSLQQKFNSNSEDLREIAKEIVNTLERRGYEIEKSGSSEKQSFNVHKKNKSYKITLQKQQKLHIVSENIESDFGVFNRNDPELSNFLKHVKKSSPTKSSSEKKIQTKNTSKSSSVRSNRSNQQSQLNVDDFENDDTVLGISREKFRTSTKFEYIVEFLDITKNNSCVFQVVKTFITNEKENPTKDSSFKSFCMKLMGDIVIKLLLVNGV